MIVLSLIRFELMKSKSIKRDLIIIIVIKFVNMKLKNKMRCARICFPKFAALLGETLESTQFPMTLKKRLDKNPNVF